MVTYMFAAVHFFRLDEVLHFKDLVQPFKQAVPYNQYCAIKDLFDVYYISHQRT